MLGTFGFAKSTTAFTFATFRILALGF
uniref:Uncharacterized protein n=1 Tax=Anguilla anguilla TaxID=7936 RepID=A0A0E9Q312_ANGAN